MKSIVVILALLPIAALAQDVMRPLSDRTLSINGVVPPQEIGRPDRNCPQGAQRSTPATGLGTTVVSYKVATDGSVKDLTLEQSGGSGVLDEKLMKCAAALRFKPATKDGKPVEYPEKIRFDWAWAAHP